MGSWNMESPDNTHNSNEKAVTEQRFESVFQSSSFQWDHPSWELISLFTLEVGLIWHILIQAFQYKVDIESMSDEYQLKQT